MEAKARGNECIRRGDYAKAAEEYTEAMETVGETAILLANRAQAYLSLGRLQEALVDAEKAAGFDPMYLKAHHRQGKALEGLLRYEEARKCYKRVLLIDPSNPESKQALDKCPTTPPPSTPIDLSPYMADSEETIQAVLVCAAGLRAEGLEHLQVQRYTEAKDCLEAGLKATMEVTTAQPGAVALEQARLFAALGETYQGLKDFKSALKYYDTAVRLGKGSESEAEMLLKRGISYQSSGDSALSKGDFAQALLLKPDFLAASQALERVNSLERQAKERKAQEEAAEIAKVLAQAAAFKEKGNSCFTRHDYDTATNEFSSGLALLTKDHSFSSNKAIKTLKTALYSNRAACSLELNCNTFAIRDCKEVLALDPANIKALYRLSQAYAHCGQTDLAISHLEKALQADPGNKTFLKEIEELRSRARLAAEQGDGVPKRKGRRKVSFKDFGVPGEDTSPLIGQRKQEDSSPPAAATSLPTAQSSPPPAPFQPSPSLLPASTKPASLSVFETHILSLHGHLPNIATYLQALDSGHILDLCQRSPLDTEILTTLLRALQLIPTALALVYLEGLSRSARFALNIKMLTKEDKGEIAALVQSLAVDSDTASRLASLYHLS